MEDNKKRFKGKVLFKHETEEHWLLSNYIPDNGEMVLYDEDEEHSYKRAKYGDGVHFVRDLPFSESSGDNTEVESEWDYIITDLADLTQKLATLEGRVLVKEVNYLAEDDPWSQERLALTVPSKVSEIKFANSAMYAVITGSKNTRIVGFKSSNFSGLYYAQLKNFGSVEFCGNEIEVFNCQNVRHCNIRKAMDCTNLDDIEVYADYYDGEFETFVRCKVIDNVRFKSGGSMTGIEEAVEFYSCTNVSNIHNLSPDFTTIQYRECSYVDGDTCDGYYTEEDVGKVRVITTDGTLQTIEIGADEDAPTGEWDYIITNASDFLGDPLSEMSGNVLVKGVNISGPGFEVDVNANIKTIKFVDCEIFAKITAKGASTAIIGLLQNQVFNCTTLSNFNRVEHCYGFIEVNKCSNIAHCTIQRAVECTNLQDIECAYVTDYDSDTTCLFDRCKLIDGVRVNSYYIFGDTENLLEFNNCAHLSNINRSGTQTIINYVGCTYVDGDTCDGYYAAEDIGKVRVITADGTLQTVEIGAEDTPTGEWDYVITTTEELLGSAFSGMSGNVLVKDIVIDFPGIEIDVNANIKVIKFINCEIHARLTAKGTNTAIIGFYGLTMGIGSYPVLKNFKRVEHCYGLMELNQCSNVAHCRIAKAVECTNLQDIECSHDVEFASDIAYTFDRCNLIDGVRISSFAIYDGAEGVLEFNNCSHLSNISRFGNQTVINYVGCTYVDGDTCDGYYTSTEAGKVQKIAENGASEFISVYSQEEIDGMLGDISSILEALHSGGIE